MGAFSCPSHHPFHAKAIELIRLAIEMTTAAGSGHPNVGGQSCPSGGRADVRPHAIRSSAPRRPRRRSTGVIGRPRMSYRIRRGCRPGEIAIGHDPDKRRPMTREDALQLRMINSPIDGHPNPFEGFPFFPAATGSLGQGLSIAAGLAAAARLDWYRSANLLPDRRRRKAAKGRSGKPSISSSIIICRQSARYSIATDSDRPATSVLSSRPTKNGCQTASRRV